MWFYKDNVFFCKMKAGEIKAEGIKKRRGLRADPKFRQCQKNKEKESQYEQRSKTAC